MAELRSYVTPLEIGSMCERLDPRQHKLGQARELRNVRCKTADWVPRLGWEKDNAVAMAWDTCIGAFAYRDTIEAVHHLIVGGNGKLYHKVVSAAGVTTIDWAEVVVHDNVVWDRTHQAQFAAWRDHCFIALGALTGTGQNLRYDGVNGVAYGVSIAAPTAALTAADGGAGLVPAGTYDFQYTFYDNGTGWESDASPVGSVTIADAGTAEVQTLTLSAAATAGTFTLRYRGYTTATIAWNATLAAIETALEELSAVVSAGDITVGGATPDAGGPVTFTFLASLGDVPMLSIDRSALTGPASALFAETTKGAEAETVFRRIALSGIQTYPGTGRNVYRKLYVSVEGQAFVGATGATAELTNNTATTYDYNLAAPTGATYIRHQAIPVCSSVAVQHNGVVHWANDVASGEAATIYLAYDENTPESIGAELQAGTHDSPIVALKPIRDGTMVFKRYGRYWLPRQCETCEAISDGDGAVSAASVLVMGERAYWMTDRGPKYETPGVAEGSSFLGTEPYLFDLNATMAAAQEDQLHRCSAGHDRANGVMLWAIQRCSWAGLQDTDGSHNDTVIVYEYAAKSSATPRGILSVDDMMVDHFYTVPGARDHADELWAAFPLGFVGRVAAGEHGDGIDQWLPIEVVSSDGHVVEIEDPGVELGVDGFKGSILHVYEGTGQRACRDILACDRPAALIVDHELTSAGRTLRTAGELGLDSTSKVLLGGFGVIADLDGITGNDPDAYKKFVRGDIHLKGVTE